MPVSDEQRRPSSIVVSATMPKAGAKAALVSWSVLTTPLCPVKNTLQIYLRYFTNTPRAATMTVPEEPTE